MEREEHTLRRTCEDLRLTLENRTKELSQSQELYSKLKQRVLLRQAQEMPPGVSRSHAPLQAAGAVDAGQAQIHSQPHQPVQSIGTRTGMPNYFPGSPNYSKTQPTATTLIDWDKPGFSQRRAYFTFNSETMR